MTTPAILPTEPLLTPERLALWAQESPLQDPVLADLIIEGVTTLLRQYGDATWVQSTLPKRARDIGYIVAKNFYLNPRQLRQETTGPLQESLDASVLTGLDFTEDQKAEIASLANGPGDGPVDGLWTLGTTRGPVETNQTDRHGSVVVFDTRAEWPIEYLNVEDSIVFFPEEP